jgi:hypothetical protein
MYTRLPVHRETAVANHLTSPRGSLCSADRAICIQQPACASTNDPKLAVQPTGQAVCQAHACTGAPEQRSQTANDQFQTLTQRADNRLLRMSYYATHGPSCRCQGCNLTSSMVASAAPHQISSIAMAAARVSGYSSSRTFDSDSSRYGSGSGSSYSAAYSSSHRYK